MPLWHMGVTSPPPPPTFYVVSVLCIGLCITHTETFHRPEISVSKTQCCVPWRNNNNTYLFYSAIPRWASSPYLFTYMHIIYTYISSFFFDSVGALWPQLSQVLYDDFIAGEVVEEVKSFKFLGTTISSDLKWDENFSSAIKKAHQRLFFLRQLKKFKVSHSILTVLPRCNWEHSDIFHHCLVQQRLSERQRSTREDSSNSL